ncbi:MULTISPECIES: hypothetical protein [unclassified Caballeronia]|uniref:hypothetical protein n=1 Tax=unclassified Caballeronia TaxID=2646786 RepID=UPI001F2F3353|nr:MULTISPECIES: hypothetical protein [unclassified Caballeronia]MCE4547449.1 hypothetical protein [Caballeronia sp. PC1]MCE4575435.1 hypothetical protein [Caballeronia sp. CLC5]
MSLVNGGGRFVLALREPPMSAATVAAVLVSCAAFGVAPYARNSRGVHPRVAQALDDACDRQPLKSAGACDSL